MRNAISMFVSLLSLYFAAQIARANEIGEVRPQVASAIQIIDLETPLLHSL